MERTITNIFQNSVNTYADRVFLSERLQDVKISITYGEAMTLVKQLADALISIGVKKGDRVAILSENRYEWCLADLAILHTGAISVGLSAKLIEREDILSRLSDCGAEVIFVSAQQLPRLRDVIAETGVRSIILFDEEEEAGVLTFRQLIAMGKKYQAEHHADNVEARLQNLKEEDVAEIIYTSGTTEKPKGVMLTHSNLSIYARTNQPEFHEVKEQSPLVVILPFDHVFMHSLVFLFIYQGGKVTIPRRGNSSLESMLYISVCIEEEKPFGLHIVPSVAKALLDIAKQKCKSSENVKENVRKSFGGRMTHMIVGGASNAPEITSEYLKYDIRCCDAYGMTETTSGMTRCTPEKFKLGSVGHVHSHSAVVEIMDEDGCICTGVKSGEVVSCGERIMKGYWNNPEATREVIDKQGWFHTGDYGHVDEDGFLFIEGRIKSLLINSSGEKYSSEGIENALQNDSPYIDQVVLYCKQSPYTIALISPDREKIALTLQQEGMSLVTEEGKKRALTLLNDAVRLYATDPAQEGRFPKTWLPAAFVVLPEGFTTDNGLLTATQKIKRMEIEKRYEKEIAYAYTPEGMNAMNANNIEKI